MKNLNTLWDLKAPFYYHLRRLPFLSRYTAQEILCLKHLLSMLPENPEQILDIGTGAGTTLSIYPKKSRVIVFDRSRSMIRSILRHFITVHSGIVGNACNLPFRRESVTLAAAVGITEYMPDLDVFLRAVHFILKPDAFFLVTCSPPHWKNRLRCLLGHRLYLRCTSDVLPVIHQNGYIVQHRIDTPLQIQMLLKKA